MKKINVAVAGLGRIGKIHLKNLCRNFPEIKVVATMDVFDESKAIADEFNVPVFVKTFDELLTVDGVDAVVICSPTDTHADYVVKAARAGKQIFCEKPLDLSLDRVNEVLEIVKKSGVKLMLGFNRRFDPEFKRIRQLVVSGAIGEVRIVKITSRDPGPPPVSYIKVSGGMFLDMTIHDFDMARYISGKQVKEVFAKGTVMVDPEIGKAGDIDTAVITLTFEDDTMAIIDNCREAVYGYDQRLEAFGSKGMAQAENEFPNNHKLYTKDGVSGDLPLYFFLERYNASYNAEIREFINALISGGDMPVDGNDGLHSIVIGLAAKKSLAEGRPVLIKEILK
ncbi:MAG: inositol 2-dehydrogenase [Bacteroidetes bacterium GWF2_42_66]|nr:MAG: inositol 2-dehydrogenase [Bacteroidetes bacterium GWA2_42_15]OFY01319.1 MAG: inositol 2-dehydrogenase [Bacteroidetes bacterium GWE2_42_39]OFY42163.1 MAG: inositol 2-dehydrogenase [Bacteroidetes bacterium GWF2_42_66]HBL77628.1 inositol 2-dehydrogenase [Prolixibacteraceae bacterium]HCB62757.1 inositol 2-dehydrogenase [Bacteroidales bacterium]